jgi:hypothetical protein
MTPSKAALKAAEEIHPRNSFREYDPAKRLEIASIIDAAIKPLVEAAEVVDGYSDCWATTETGRAIARQLNTALAEFKQGKGEK